MVKSVTNNGIQVISEYEWEAQEQLTEKGFMRVAPKEGTYRNLNDAVQTAGKCKDAVIVCHTYCGRGKGYIVFSKNA